MSILGVWLRFNLSVVNVACWHLEKISYKKWKINLFIFKYWYFSINILKEIWKHDICSLLFGAGISITGKMWQQVPFQRNKLVSSSLMFLNLLLTKMRFLSKFFFYNLPSFLWEKSGEKKLDVLLYIILYSYYTCNQTT